MPASLKVFYLLLIASLMACTGSRTEPMSFESDAGQPQTELERHLRLFQQPIREDSCAIPMTESADSGAELMSFIRAGDPFCLKKVIRSTSVNVNEPHTVFGQTQKVLPLWQALKMASLFFAQQKTTRSFAVLKVLIEAGADMNVRNENQQTPLQYSLENEELFNRHPMVSLYFISIAAASHFESHRESFYPLHWSIKRKSELHLQLLLNKNVSANQKTDLGVHPLALALQDQFITGFLLLMSNGAELHFMDEEGQRALHFAKDAEAVDMLLNLGITQDQQNSAGQTALNLGTRDLEQAENLLNELRTEREAILTQIQNHAEEASVEALELRIRGQALAVEISNINLDMDRLNLLISKLQMMSGL